MVQLLNQIFTQSSYPSTWSTDVIKPILKAGDPTILNNYREITLLPTIGKIFTQILSNRISNWAINNKILNESQFGFRKGRRTTDASFIITSAIDYAKKRNHPLFACIVDLAKAFNTINHNLLWKKLMSIGLSTKILNILQSIYKDANSLVSSNDLYSYPFPCSEGVCQGCNLSPLLFNLYINDLENYLMTNSTGFIQLNHAKLYLLMFADNILLLVESPSSLQDSINYLNNFCDQWKVQINKVKTKVLIFNKPNSKYSFSINSKPLYQCSECKYLGITLSAKHPVQ